MLAAKANDLHTCELFLSAGVAVEDVFDKVARDGCTSVVRALLAHQPSPQALGNALIWAAHGNHHELVELLVVRADLHKYGSEALWWAAHCNHWRVLECLLAAMVAAKARLSPDDPWVAMLLEKTLAPTHQGLLPRLLALGVDRSGS